VDDVAEEYYRGILLPRLAQLKLDKVCCDKFNDAVRTGQPCDPRKDVDCDGKPNKSDSHSGGLLPMIDGVFTDPHAQAESFPRGMTLDEIMPPDQCKDCKWELTKGELKCNPDPTKIHSYKATWRCPTTGQVFEVTKYSKPGASCYKP
jgi:hypothetical protein